MLLSRRNALRSLFFAAPAIVAAPTLMRISAKFLTLEEAAVTPSLDDLITATLRNQSAQLAKSVMKNNAILKHLLSRASGPYQGKIDWHFNA